jgi:hypothetical protein
VAAIVTMLLGENSRTVVARTKERLAAVQKTLPSDVRLEILYDRADLIQRTLHTVVHNLLEGGVLVVLVLLVMLGSWRAGLVVALAIPLSMLVAANVMLATGVTASLMSLGAIDFGLIVDSSVIMVENCMRRIAHPLGGSAGGNAGEPTDRSHWQEAGLARRGDAEPYRIVLGERRELAEVPAFRFFHPTRNHVERHATRRLGRLRALPKLVEATPAEVVGEPLHQHRARVPAESSRNERQIVMVDLFLERAGGGGDDHLAPGEHGRQKIRERLAGSGACLAQEHPILSQCALHGLGHLELSGALLVGSELAGERSAWTEELERGRHRAFARSGAPRPRREGRSPRRRGR